MNTKKGRKLLGLTALLYFLIGLGVSVGQDMPVSWEAQGAKDAGDRALQMLADILKRESQAEFTPDIEARIRSEFQGLVDGNLKIPVGL